MLAVHGKSFQEVSLDRKFKFTLKAVNLIRGGGYAFPLCRGIRVRVSKHITEKREGV